MIAIGWILFIFVLLGVMYHINSDDKNKWKDVKDEEIRVLKRQSHNYVTASLDLALVLQQVETVIEKENTPAQVKVDEVLKLLQEYEETHGDPNSKPESNNIKKADFGQL